MKPILLTDLDDTLFQTARKMREDDPRVPAALGIDGLPISFMDPVQDSFVRWALEHMEVVPVTARSIDVFKRVQIPFRGFAVCTHGAVILDASGEIDEPWQRHMDDALRPYQATLMEHLNHLMHLGEKLNFSLRGWAVEAGAVNAYIVIKSNDSNYDDLQRLIAAYPEPLDGFYVHRNGNNLAILPDVVSKRAAVAALLQRLNGHPGRPVMGLGDSLSDFGFMQLCHWWGAPVRSQLTEKVLSGA